jgi:hypothetical protein
MREAVRRRPQISRRHRHGAIGLSHSVAATRIVRGHQLILVGTGMGVVAPALGCVPD